MSKLDLDVKPGPGTQGYPVKLKSNHYSVEVSKDRIYEYKVEILPITTCSATLRNVVNMISTTNNLSLAFNGGTVAYSPDSLTTTDFEVHCEKRRMKFNVTFTLTTMLNPQDLSKQKTYMFLNVLTKQYSHDWFTSAGQGKFFSPDFGNGKLTKEVDYWNGFFQSVNPTALGPTLAIDTATKAFIVPTLVSDYLEANSRTEHSELEKFLVGLKVDVFYPDHTRRYTISRLLTLKAQDVWLDDEKSLPDYYKSTYKIDINPDLLVVQAKNRRRILLPTDTCHIIAGQTAGTQYISHVSPLTKQIRHVSPRTKQIRIEDAFNRNQYSTCTRFGIHLSDSPTEVGGRVLQRPRVKEKVKGGIVERWFCVSFGVSGTDLINFCDNLVLVCNSRGLKFKPCLRVRSMSKNSNNNAIEKVLRDIHSETSLQRLDLLVVILPHNTRNQSYDLIKRICETELGIVTQCCRPKTALSGKKELLEYLSMKINVKVGGKNLVLERLQLMKQPGILDIPTIVFGADVTHGRSDGSIAAVVASTDWPEISQFRALVSLQKNGVEMIDNLYGCVGKTHKGMIREHLLYFYNNNRETKPERIIVYRDGIDEGQFNRVLQHEVAAIKQACASLDETYQPPVTVIACLKRHHTRLFPADPTNSSKSGNLLAGTVVDTNICHPKMLDFFLCSHLEGQGTSKPTHYFVLFDENNMTADQIQSLTYDLCYGPSRCTRPVSIVPAVGYAHLAAARARSYGVKDGKLPEVDEKVKSVMYYC